jgi:S-formylglutathione hydrolase FrmB
MHGWLLAVVQLVTVAAVVYAIGWRDRRWRIVWLPVAAGVGALSSIAAQRYYGTLGIASEPPPWQMWLWVCLVGLAVTVAVAGWRSAGWARRNASVFAVSFCLLSMGLTINGWLGYFPTVGVAWSQLTGAPLPDQADLRTVEALRAKGVAPQHGLVMEVHTGSDASGFAHRSEWVYLPPAWFGAQPPRLPAVLMVGGEFNTPADWARAGDAVATLDAYAATHAGFAPVAVFADSTGGFGVDTECVNGSHGKAADHLTLDVVPRVNTLVANAGATTWGVVGFSSGGTCALDLAVMHPDIFRAFVDIGGDSGPNEGTRAQTIDRLYGGDENAWYRFDPSTVITRHGNYAHLSGLFVVPGPVGLSAAESLCGLGRAKSISCRVEQIPGKHDWPSAAAAFETALPWLTSELDARGSAAAP